MDSRQQQRVLQQVAEFIQDYRQDQIPAPTSQHVERWLAQFSPQFHEPILRDLWIQFGHYHILQSWAEDWIRQVLAFIAGDDPKRALSQTVFDTAGSPSQKHWLEVAQRIAYRTYGCSFANSPQRVQHFVVLDDAAYTGHSVAGQLRALFESQRVKRGMSVHVALFASHTREPRQGEWRRRSIDVWLDRFERAGVRVERPCLFRFENRRWHTSRFDCYWPRELGDDSLLADYLKLLRAKATPSIPMFRPSSLRGDGFAFDSEETRQQTEWAFLLAGLRILAGTKYWGTSLRPMGWDSLPTLGFGAVFSTYRNAPNNAPLALWAGASRGWYPLLPRRPRPITARYK